MAFFQLGQHPKTPRVFGVTDRRILRRQTISTVYCLAQAHVPPRWTVFGFHFVSSLRWRLGKRSAESFNRIEINRPVERGKAKP